MVRVSLECPSVCHILLIVLSEAERRRAKDRKFRIEPRPGFVDRECGYYKNSSPEEKAQMEAEAAKARREAKAAKAHQDAEDARPEAEEAKKIEALQTE